VLPSLALTLTLQLSNISGVPPPVLAQAQLEMVRLYAAIGVEIRWSEMPGDIRLIVMNDEPGDLRRASQMILGAAIHGAQGSSVAYVFYRRVADEANKHDVSRSLLLACAMAHEVGHLLLPGRPHSRAGLMRGVWDYDEFHRAANGLLRFSAEEGESIRARQNLIGSARVENAANAQNLNLPVKD
jgi:hypothetical protein